MILSRDAVRINEVVNHPAVRPFVGAPELGELDLSPVVDRPENLFPFGEHGGFAFVWTAPRTLEVHTFILPEGRGKWARRAAAEAIAMARQSGAVKLWTKIPPDLPNVEAYARCMGMRPTGEVIETFGKPYAVFELEIEQCQ